MKYDTKKATEWIGPVVFAVILNVGLFSLMPGLLFTASDGMDSVLPAYPVNVIRIKRPETPPKKKEAQKPEPEKQVRQKTVKQELFKNAHTTRLQLPFEINPSLPEMPGVTPSLFMEKYAVHGLEAYDMGAIDKPITVLAQVPPIYPMRARRLGIEGWVRIKILVSAKGDVENVDILESEPNGVFENSVIQCVQSWRFSPGTKDGEPVKTLVQTTIRFSLENE